MADCEPSARRFMDLTVPDYAYMFGFLQADGHLHQGVGQKGRLTVELNIKDIDLLYRFKHLTPFNSSVTERTRSTNFAENHHSATWTLCSLVARTKLNELGLPYGRKSRSITPSSNAIGSYLCFYARKITGVERVINLNARDEVYNISYEKEAAQALVADLYYPGCLSLGRKQVKADRVTSWSRPVDMRIMQPRRNWTAQEDLVLLQSDDIEALAKELGRTERACRLRLWRLRNSRVLTPTDQ